MFLSYFLILIGFLLLFGGLLGCFLPIIPGPPLSFGGMLLIHFSDFADMTDNFLYWWAAITVFVTALDYVVPVYGSKRLGGSKYGMIGASIGLVAGLFFPPFGLILGPLLGAFVGELSAGQNKNAMKSALGTFVGFLVGILIKCIACIFMIYYSIENIWQAA